MLYTRPRLRRACYQVLTSPAFILRIGALPDCRARLDERGKVASVTVDQHQSGLIEGAIHEALHVVLDRDLLGIFYRQERAPSLWEAVLDTLETIVAEDVLSDAKETEKWRRAIDRKLSEAS